MNPYIVATPFKQDSTGKRPSSDVINPSHLVDHSAKFATSPLDNFTLEWKEPLALTNDFFMHDYDMNSSALFDRSLNSMSFSTTEMDFVATDSPMMKVSSPSFAHSAPWPIASINPAVISGMILEQNTMQEKENCISPRRLVGHNPIKITLPNKSASSTDSTSSKSKKSNSSRIATAPKVTKKKKKAPLSTQSHTCARGICFDCNRSAESIAESCTNHYKSKKARK